MWWCRSCVKIFCSKCDVKQHRSYSHHIVEWNTLQGVKDCYTFLLQDGSQNRKLEEDLKQFFSEVTKEILASAKAISGKIKNATYLAEAYGIEDEKLSEEHISDVESQSDQILLVVHQALSLAGGQNPSDGRGLKQAVQNIICNLSPKSVAQLLLTDSLLGGGSKSGGNDKNVPTCHHIQSNSSPAPTREPKPDEMLTLAPKPQPPPVPIVIENSVVDHPSNLELSCQLLGKLPGSANFCGMRSCRYGKYFAFLDNRRICIYQRLNLNMQLVNYLNIQCDIVDVCVSENGQIYVLGFEAYSSDALYASLLGYTLGHYKEPNICNDTLDLTISRKLKICSVSGAVYIAQQMLDTFEKKQKRKTGQRKTVIHKYSIYDRLLHPVATIDDSNFGDVTAMSAIRTEGFHYTDVIAVGYQYATVIVQVSDSSTLLRQKEFPGEYVAFTRFGTMNSDGCLDLLIIKESRVIYKLLKFDRELTKTSGNQPAKLNRMKWLGPCQNINNGQSVNFGPEIYGNAAIYALDSGFRLAKFISYSQTVDIYKINGNLSD